MSWADTLKVGDLLLTRNKKTLRVVRAVSVYRGRVQCVTLSIRKCSWTKRPYTVINRHDLVHSGYTKVEGVRAKRGSADDLLFLQDLNAPFSSDCVFSCSDVRRLL